MLYTSRVIIQKNYVGWVIFINGCASCIKMRRIGVVGGVVFVVGRCSTIREDAIYGGF